MPSRFIVGIDLGTSNCALAYVDREDGKHSKPNVASIPQYGPGTAIEEPSLLPSFLYLLPPGDAAFNAQQFGTAPGRLAGSYARAQTAYQPERVISSAKSWLCHSAVDREANILPWGSTDVTEQERLSPVAVSALFLSHLRAAFNAQIAANENEFLEHQEIVLTVPASFDEAAQRLTLAAAQNAGLTNVRLLEEPQAAFYHWLEANSLRETLYRERPALAEQRSVVLICDIGGGTTDFSLFEVAPGVAGSSPIKRLAVSEHILLGGDNIDLALAYEIEPQLLNAAGRKLTPRQWMHLVHAARSLKERVLGGEAPLDSQEQFFVSVPAEGQSLFAQPITGSITHARAVEIVLEGFFPFVQSDASPLQQGEGLAEWGLPFASDSAITRHLAYFLRGTNLLQGRQVDAILCNGGTLTPAFLRERLCQVIAAWQQGEMPVELQTTGTDVAVALGAAYYGTLLRDKEQRIEAGYARSLYLELHSDIGEAARQLLCVVPQGTPANERSMLREQPLELLVGRPVRFQLFHSTSRPEDRPGQLVAFEAERFHALPPLQTVVAAGAAGRGVQEETRTVFLEAVVSETGLLTFELVEAEAEQPKRWQLEFNLRATGGRGEPSEVAEVDRKVVDACERMIGAIFGKAKSNATAITPKKLIPALEAEIGSSRDQWSTALLRALWTSLERGITRRGRSLSHETSWLHLAGWCLRPGYGAPLDEWRMDQAWRAFELGLAFPKESTAVVQWWIFWRRIAGGLDQQRQQLLWGKALKQVGRKGTEVPELFRLLGSLERVAQAEKEALGALLIERLSTRRVTGIEPYIWALGRLGSRVPLYGSAHQVVAPAIAARWFECFAEQDWTQGDYGHLNAAFSQMLRRTDDRARDVSEEIRRSALQKMERSGATTEQLTVVREYVPFELTDQVRLFGDALPAGLRLSTSAT
ncbi:MAG: Hsp70 family protein [Bdellovibrionales bacterium]|nr:Hsp70 family protein [Bdellovibrionales bacterium]